MADSMRTLLGWEEPQAPETSSNGTFVDQNSAGPGLWTSVVESWKISRDLDGTGAAIGRMSEESAFPLDPEYNLQNLDALLKQVPEGQRESLANSLVQAKSAQHADWITNRFKHEMQAEVDLSQYGTTGFVTRLGASLFDESLILGLALAPVGAAHKVSRLARILSFGGMAAGENAMQEAIVAASSPTRTAEDVAYAAAFGFIFGGVVGGVSKGLPTKAPENTPEARTTETHPSATPETETPAATVSHVKPLQENTVTDLVLVNGEKTLDAAATGAKLPPVQEGHTRLYRAESPTVKFEDVFDTEKLYEFSPEDKPGKFYTDSLDYADYFRLTYGRDATIRYVDVPNARLKEAQVKDGYVLDLDAKGGAVSRMEDEIPEMVSTADAPAQAAMRAVDEMDKATIRLVKNEPVPEPTPRMQESISAHNESLADDVGIVPREADLVDAVKAATDRLADIQARMRELRSTVVDAPVRPVIADELKKVQESQAALDAAIAAADPVARTNADRAFQQAKRHFMRIFREQATDDFNKSGLSVNPKNAEFLAWMKGKGAKVAAKAEKQFAKDTEAYNKTLDKMDEELLALKDEHRTLTEGMAPPDNQLKSAGASAINAEGSVGADLVEFTEDVMDELANVPDSAFTRWRLGGYAILNRSENPVFKWLGHVLLPDHVGAKDKSYVAKPSAVMRGEQLQERVIAKYSAAYKAGLREWAIANGHRHVLADPKVEDQFNRLVAAAVESGTDDAAVAKVAKAFSDGVKETFEYARKAGVKGFDKFEHRNDYLPHIHNTEAFRRYHLDLRAGPDGANVEVIYHALRRANEDMDEKLARKVAKQYVDTVLRKSAGYGGKYYDLKRVVDDPDYAKELFADMDLSEGELADLMSNLFPPSQQVKDGGIARTKRRALLDMDTEITVFDQTTGQDRQFHIRELFEQNASKLMHSYVRSVGGWAAIADATKGTAIHINSPAKLEAILRKGLDFETQLGPRKDKAGSFVAKLSSGRLGSGTGGVAESEAELIRMVTNSLTGIPINDPNSMATIAARRLKDVNFTIMMGQVMWAQLSEMGATIATLGWRHTLKAMPQLRAAMRRAKETGQLDLELARVVEEFLGIGTTALRGRAHPMWVSDLDALDGAYNKFDSFLHQAKNVVAAPMHAMMTAQQRIMGIGMLHKFGDFAMGRIKLSEGELTRLRQVGISADDLENIKKMYAKNAKWSNMQTRSGDLLNPNFDLWEDQDAFLKLRDGIFRLTKRAVQENDMGNVPPMLSKNLASVLFQFRSFIFGAWEKHLLTNLHNRDFEAFAQFQLQTMFAGLGYVGMTYTKALGMDEKDKRRYLKDRLSADAIGKASFARTGYSSILPGVADTALWFGGYNGMFQNTRGSELSQNFITGSPTVATIGRAYNAARGLVAAPTNPDYNYSRQDLSALRYSLPFANLLGVHNVWNAIGSSLELPYKSTDD